MDPPFDQKTNAIYQETVQAFLIQLKNAVEKSGDIGHEAFPEYLNLVERLADAYSTFINAHASWEDDDDDDDDDNRDDYENIHSFRR